MATPPEPGHSLHLADLDAGDLVLVCAGPATSATGKRNTRFRPGEVLQCIDRSDRDILVATQDGTRFRVVRAVGMKIEVRLFWETGRMWELDGAPPVRGG